MNNKSGGNVSAIKRYIGVLKIILGLFMIITVIIGYLPEPEYIIELTCISNALCGILLITDGIINALKGTKIPSILYLNLGVCIFSVFLISMGSLSGIYKINLSGAFFFLHTINPILFIALYIFFGCDGKESLKTTFSAPILMILYLLLDYIQCQFSGSFVYNFVNPGELSFLDAIIVGIVMYIIMLLFGSGLFGLNKLAHKKHKNKG